MVRVVGLVVHGRSFLHLWNLFRFPQGLKPPIILPLTDVLKPVPFKAPDSSSKDIDHK
jgi:hypothetical protein